MVNAEKWKMSHSQIQIKLSRIDNNFTFFPRICMTIDCPAGKMKTIKQKGVQEDASLVRERGR